MIRKNLLRTALITTVVATILTTTACGKKSASNADNNTQEVTTVSTETKSNAAKELTKTEDKNDSLIADNSTAETDSKNEETNTLESASDGDNSLNAENNNSDENTSSGGSADTGNESDSGSDNNVNNDGGNTEESNGGDTDSQPSDNEQGNEETPSPEPAKQPENTPNTPEPQEKEEPKTEAPTEKQTEAEKKAIVECYPHLQLSNGYNGGQGDLEIIGDYLFPQYIDGSLSEADMKSLIMNGKLYDINTWDEDGNKNTIPEAKMLSVEIRKYDKSQVSEMRNDLFGEWIGQMPGKGSGSYVRFDNDGNPYEWYAFLLTYAMP